MKKILMLLDMPRMLFILIVFLFIIVFNFKNVKQVIESGNLLDFIKNGIKKVDPTIHFSIIFWILLIAYFIL